MTFEEIIHQNCQNTQIHWWPRFAYHYTDIQNAVSILESGLLYSRYDATRLGLMKTDNASSQVIDNTESDVIKSVRFFFRPMTPTQYHNEGYKHPQLRYELDCTGNCPVPVFFAFNLGSLLKQPETSFSPSSRAGFSPTMHTGVDEFMKLDFSQIYKSGPMTNPVEEKAFRQAEIAHSSPFQVDSCLETILCRNEFEQNMLLSMIARKSMGTYRKYRERIKVCRQFMFQNNGLFISNLVFSENKLSIVFSDTYEKRRYTRTQKSRNNIAQLTPVNCKLILDWYNNMGRITRKSRAVSEIDYEKPLPLRLSLPPVEDAKQLSIQVYLEDSLIGFKMQVLQEAQRVF